MWYKEFSRLLQLHYELQNQLRESEESERTQILTMADKVKNKALGYISRFSPELSHADLEHMFTSIDELESIKAVDAGLMLIYRHIVLVIPGVHNSLLDEEHKVQAFQAYQSSVESSTPRCVVGYHKYGLQITRDLVGVKSEFDNLNLVGMAIVSSPELQPYYLDLWKLGGYAVKGFLQLEQAFKWGNNLAWQHIKRTKAQDTIEDSQVVLLGANTLFWDCLAQKLYDSGYGIHDVFTSWVDATTHVNWETVRVLIVENWLPDDTGLEVIRRLQKQSTKITIIVVLCEDDPLAATLCLAHGAKHCVVRKDSAEQEIVQIVKSVLPISTENNLTNILESLTPFDASALQGRCELSSQFANLIQREYTNINLSLSECAYILNTNTTYLSDAIQKCWHMPFRQLLARVRIAEFIKLVRENQHNSLTVEAFGYIVGYSRRATFTDACKLLTGHTPAELIQILADTP